MSKTIRISDDLYETIDDYRTKNQSFQDVIEEMAEEIGLLPARIQDADDLRIKLKNLYDYTSEETSKVCEALRYVYIAQEKKQTIGVPHEPADQEYENEIDALKRLGLVKEKHYTGKYDFGYRTTAVGGTIGSELVRELLNENEPEFENLLNSYPEELLGIMIRFGFNKTDTGHLSNRGAELAGQYVTDIWDIQELRDQYADFTEELINTGIAATYGSSIRRVVLPPEFGDYLQQRGDPELMSVMGDIEIYQTILEYTRDNLEVRNDILENLDTATEDEFQNRIEEFHEAGLTSRYLSEREAPLLIKDKKGVESRIVESMKELLRVAE